MKKIISLCFAGILLASLFALSVQTASAEEEHNSNEDFMDTTPFAGKRIGVEEGSIYGEILNQFIENPQISYYASNTDSYVAMLSGKVDAIVSDDNELQYMASQTGDMEVGRLESEKSSNAFGFPKTDEGEKLCAELSEFIRSMKESGELDELYEGWLDGTITECSIDYESLPETNQVVVIATPATYKPFDYIADGKLTGLEIDILNRFFLEYGYRPDFRITEFAGMLAGVVTGKFDVACSAVTITEERKKEMLFSEPYMDVYPGLAYLKETESNFFQDLKDSFTGTFVTENRWKLFADGCLVTLEITVFSILFGTAVGFGAHLLCRNGNRIARIGTDAMKWLINGTPVVVFLMIVYYVLFQKVPLSGVAVSIFAFMCVFACQFHDMLLAGERAVDAGQTKAAYALGYSKHQTFFKIILPQAIRHIIPSFNAAVSGHLKATAVVGYVSVVDLTKAGDLVRGQTFDAFFPLIAVTVLYFVLAALLQKALNLLYKHLDPRSRTPEQILKGAVLK